MPPNELASLMLMLGEMRGDIKALLDHRSTNTERLNKIETDVDDLKSYRGKVAGFAIGASFFATFVVNFLPYIWSLPK